MSTCRTIRRKTTRATTKSAFDKMFSMDNFDLEATMARHFFEGSQATNASNSSSEYFFGEEHSSESDDDDDAYSSGFNSDQENTEKT